MIALLVVGSLLIAFGLIWTLSGALGTPAAHFWEFAYVSLLPVVGGLVLLAVGALVALAMGKRKLSLIAGGLIGFFVVITWILIRLEG